MDAQGDEPGRMADFEPYVGRAVAVEGADGFPLVLSAVEAGRPGGGREPFILVFRGPKPGPVLMEGLHVCRIEGGPTCTLYIMPIHTPQPDRQEYQSVFG